MVGQATGKVGAREPLLLVCTMNGYKGRRTMEENGEWHRLGGGCTAEYSSKSKNRMKASSPNGTRFVAGTQNATHVVVVGRARYVLRKTRYSEGPVRMACLVKFSRVVQVATAVHGASGYAAASSRQNAAGEANMVVLEGGGGVGQLAYTATARRSGKRGIREK